MNDSLFIHKIVFIKLWRYLKLPQGNISVTILSENINQGCLNLKIRLGFRQP